MLRKMENTAYTVPMQKVPLASVGSKVWEIPLYVHDEVSIDCDYAKVEQVTLRQQSEATLKFLATAPTWHPLDIGEFGKEVVKVLRHPIKNSCSAEPEKLCHYANAHLDQTREVAGKTWCVVKVENDGTVHWGSSSGGKSEVVCPPLPPRDTTGPYASKNPQLQKFKSDLAKAYGMSDRKWDEIPKK